MNQVYVVVAVDTIGALAKGTLESFVYMADTNKYLGSWQEGTSDLQTICQDGQIIIWSATSIDAGNAVTVQSISGPMVDDKICQPQPNITLGDGVLAGRVQSRGGFGGHAYTIVLSLGGKLLSVSAELKIA